jgi:hypothetical protein
MLQIISMYIVSHITRSKCSIKLHCVAQDKTLQIGKQ